MDGCKLFVISGIDGNFKEFNDVIENKISMIPYYKYPYNSSLTFFQNVEIVKNVLLKENQKFVVMGWSIGAVLSAFVADCNNISSIIMINAFYNRSEVLKKRHIFCDEEVCITMSKKTKKKYVIIRGEQDEKIPKEESEKIVRFYGKDVVSLHSFPTAKHSLSTFPTDEIISVINEVIATK